MAEYASLTADSVRQSKMYAAQFALVHKTGPSRLHDDRKTQL